MNLCIDINIERFKLFHSIKQQKCGHLTRLAHNLLAKVLVTICELFSIFYKPIVFNAAFIIFMTEISDVFGIYNSSFAIIIAVRSVQFTAAITPGDCRQKTSIL